MNVQTNSSYLEQWPTHKYAVNASWFCFAFLNYMQTQVKAYYYLPMFLA